MIELTVKTLDSKNHMFSVPDDITVAQLKERIADPVNIAAESQRLIYCGRVLQDEKNLSEYDVNGKVIHLVQRVPPVSNGNAGDRGPSNTRSNSGTSGPRRGQQWRTFFSPGTNSGMYVGAMSIPTEIMDASGISMQQPRQCTSQNRLTTIRIMLRRASVILHRLENHPQESSADGSPENEGSPPIETSVEEEGASGGVQLDDVPIAVDISPATFIIDHQLGVGRPSVEVQTEAVSEQNNSTPEPEPEAASSSDMHQQQNANEGDGNSSGSSRYPRTRAFAELLDQAAEINTRVQPFMSQYRQLMRDDPVFSDQAAVATNQRLFTSVSEIMHNLAHAYHALSDILCDFSQAPPRILRCRPVLIHHSAVVQTGIPIQLSANLASGSSNQQSSTTNANSTSSENEARAATATEEPSTTSEEPATTNEEPSTTSEEPVTTGLPVNDVTQPAPNTQAQTQPQQPHSPSTSPPRVARIGSVGGIGPGFEFFVDVAPGSITIDSVETTVVTNTPPNTSSEPSNAWQTPPEFVQNLITALAGQFMGATLQQYQQNTGTNSQQQVSSSGSQQSGPSTQAATSASTQQSTSSQSAASTQQNANNTQNSQARVNTATHPTTATQTRSTARPHVHLSPSVHGLRTNSFDPFLPCNSHHIRGRVSRNRTGQPQVSTSSNPVAEAARVIPISAPNSISISLRADPISLINVEQGSSRSTGSRRAAHANLPPELQLPAELQAMVQNLRNTNNVMFGGQSPTTLAQLLESVPGYSYTPGERILTDVFMTIAQSFTFMDMVQLLGLGNSECLERARPQLCQLINQRLLNNEPFTISAITQLIDRLNNELRPQFSIFDNVRLREDVDLPASISLYNHSMLPSILNTVMEEEQSTFHRTLMRKCSLYLRQLYALLEYCCLDGVTGLESVLRTFADQITTGVPLVLQGWTMSHLLVNFRIFANALNVSPDDIKRFLVFRAGNTAASPQPATSPSSIPSAAEPMETQDVEEVEIESTPTLREPPIADVPPSQPINEMMGWQSTLPSEWVPIITKDSQRQRRQNPQGPFSDAYLSGMPSKRRKLLTSSKPQGNLSQVITESMATALGAAGMSSGPEVDVIAQRAGQDGTLRAAYREQVRDTVCHNLNTNPDYLPEKYPNTAKYFKKQ